MARISVSAACEHISEILVKSSDEPVILERRGQEVAVVIRPARYRELLEAWEDAQDVAAFDEAMAEEGTTVPWEQVKVDLGWR